MVQGGRLVHECVYGLVNAGVCFVAELVDGQRADSVHLAVLVERLLRLTHQVLFAHEEFLGFPAVIIHRRIRLQLPPVRLLLLLNRLAINHLVQSCVHECVRFLRERWLLD